MKLRKIVIDGEIVYTMKDELKGQKTKEAHYKFVKIRGPKNCN